MKIFTFKRVVALAAIGGFAYVHKQRGGQWTVASIKDTLRRLWSDAVTKLGQIEDDKRRPQGRAANLSETTGRDVPPGEHGSRSFNDNNRRKDTPNRP